MMMGEMRQLVLNLNFNLPLSHVNSYVFTAFRV